MERMYYKSETTNVENFLEFKFFDNKCGAFESFAGRIETMREVEKDDEELEMLEMIDGKPLWVVSIDEDWKHNLIERLVNSIDIDLIEKIIGDVGIRRAFEIVGDCGFGDMKLEELSSDIGMRRILYCILDQQLEIADGFDEIDEDEWNALRAKYYDDEAE